MKKFLILALLAPLMGAFALLPHDSYAASQPINLTFSGSGNATSVISALAVCDECAPDAFFSDPNGVLQTWGLGASVTITGQASWTNPAPVNLQYSAGNLRHGATLDLSDTLTPGAGSVTINYSASGTIGIFGSAQTGNLSCAVLAVANASCNGWVPTTDSTNVGPINDSDTFACTMPLPGESPRTCSNTKTINIWSGNIFGIASASVDLILDEQVVVTGSGVVSLRIATVSGGQAIPNNNITFGGTSPSTVADPLAISCTQPVGSDLLYSLTNNSYTAEPATYSGDLKIKLSASVPVLGGVSYTTPALVSTSGADLGPIPMTALDRQVDLGPVLANNTPPTASAGGPYSGNEGSPIAFDGTGSTSVCGASSLAYTWNFSDGGVAYGAQTTHTFESPGTFSGQLTVTDVDGNSNTSDFSVTVANLPPVVTAGPDMSTAWGVPVTLNGQATDPGTAEQPFLTYSWDFGDGSPSASGGPSVSHVYAAPGTYTATFTACDPESACSSATMNVVVRKRNTTTGYLGTYNGTYNTSATFSASLVDEFGQNVSGRTVSFKAGTESEGSASTNSSGIATTSNVTQLTAGSYTATANFAGDSLYNGSFSSGTLAVTPKATSLTYTGPTSSLPSKKITMTAVLTDATGNPLSGKSVTFTLGSLPVLTSVTDASGVASVTLKVPTPPGNYPLTISYAPSSGDAAMYVGTSASLTFHIGK